MDRRFFENDNLEDLTKNESLENFQKIEDEDEVLKENYMWSDEEYDFSSETDLNQSDDYPQSEGDLEDDIQVDENYEDLGDSASSEEYITSEDDAIIKVNCKNDEEHSDSEYDKVSESNFKCNYKYCDSDDNTSTNDRCDCNCKYCDSEEDYECNYSESEQWYSSNKTSSCNNNYSSTFEEDKRYRENNKYYLKGKKDGYNAGYEAGARDAIRAAYKAGYKRGLRAAGYRI